MHNPFKDLSRPQLYAVLAGGTAIAAYAEYRHHAATGSWSPFATSSAESQDTSEAATGSPGTVTDPTTGQEYSDTAVDPSTQMTYASEITQYGSVQAAEAEVSSFGGTAPTTQSYDTGYTYAQQTDNLTTTSGENIYTSNSAWAQAVQAGLEDVSGSTSYDNVDIGTALGLFLQGEPLSADQASLINTAMAEYGRPPVGNLQIITTPTVTAPTPPATTTTKPTESYPAPTGLTQKKTTGYVRQISWNLIKGTAATGPTPTSYTVAVDRVGDGKSIVDKTVSTPDTASGKGQTDVTILPLPTGWKSATYKIRVWANGTTGIGPKSASLEFVQT